MIATLEAPAVTFDLALYLEPGREYDHVALKHIIWQVYDLGLDAQEGDVNYRIGAAFSAAVYEWLDAGLLEMTEAVDRDGDACDFYSAVFASHHPDNVDFKKIDGWLKIAEMPL
jgi:hypothetical protein